MVISRWLLALKINLTASKRHIAMGGQNTGIVREVTDMDVW